MDYLSGMTNKEMKLRIGIYMLLTPNFLSLLEFFHGQAMFHFLSSHNEL